MSAMAEKHGKAVTDPVAAPPVVDQRPAPASLGTAVPKHESMRALEQEMDVVIRRLKRVMSERARMIHPDLAPLSYSMLMTLASHGELRSSSLVEMFAIDKGAVSRHVQQLEELGLISRTPDPCDRRAALLRLTANARGRLDKVGDVRRQELLDRFGGWTDEELAMFVTALRRYNETIEP